MYSKDLMIYVYEQERTLRTYTNSHITASHNWCTVESIGLPGASYTTQKAANSIAGS